MEKVIALATEFIISAVCFAAGLVLGRREARDSYLRGYLRAVCAVYDAMDASTSDCGDE